MKLVLVLIAALALALPFASASAFGPITGFPGVCSAHGVGIVSAYPASWGMTQARADMLCANYYP